MLFYHDGKTIPTAPTPKDPDSVLDYGCDWSGWLQDAETVTASAWIVEDGLTGSAETNTGLVTGVMLSGGVDGTTYTITNRIDTSLGRTINRSMLIECGEL